MAERAMQLSSLACFITCILLGLTYFFFDDLVYAALPFDHQNRTYAAVDEDTYAAVDEDTSPARSTCPLFLVNKTTSNDSLATLNWSIPLAGGGLNNCFLRAAATLFINKYRRATLLPFILTVPWSMRSLEPGHRWASLAEFYDPQAYCDSVRRMGFAMPVCHHLPPADRPPYIALTDPSWHARVTAVSKAASPGKYLMSLDAWRPATLGQAVYIMRSFKPNNVYSAVIAKMVNTVNFHAKRQSGYIAVHMRIEKDMFANLKVSAEDIIHLVNQSHLLDNATDEDPANLWISSGAAVSTTPKWTSATGKRTFVYHKNSFNGLFHLDLSEKKENETAADHPNRVIYIARCIVDMEVASQATVFIGHLWSTFTQRIITNRLLSGVEENYVYANGKGKLECLRQVTLNIDVSKIDLDTTCEWDKVIQLVVAPTCA